VSETRDNTIANKLLENTLNHPIFQTLLDYLGNRVSADEQIRIKTHLDSCEVCRNELEVAQRTLLGLRAAELTSPPPTLLNNILSAFRRRQTRSAQPIRVLPHLQFDSWTQRAALGLRGGTITDRQLLYSYETFDLDLQIVRTEHTDLLALQGQILVSEEKSVTPEGIVVGLTSQTGDDRFSVTDELGRFGIARLGIRDYILRLTFDTYDVIIDPLTISL
jgi:hypothetical protein